MKHLYHLPIIALLLLFVSSCEKELDFKYHDVDSPLVIEATLSQTGSTVRLTHTTPMNETMDSIPVTDATVALHDLTDGTSRMLSLRDDGTFGDNMPGITGHQYSVEVATADAAYTSVSTMRRPTEISDMEFSWIKMPYDEVAVLQVSFNADPDDPDDCYWIRLLRNGEPYMWSTINGLHNEEGTINAVFMTSRKNTEEEDEKSILVDGDEITAIVSPVSLSFMDYLSSLSADSNGIAMWKGGFCLGYFLAAPVAEKTIIFHPELIK